MTSADSHSDFCVFLANFLRVCLRLLWFGLKLGCAPSCSSLSLTDSRLEMSKLPQKLARSMSDPHCQLCAECKNLMCGAATREFPYVCPARKAFAAFADEFCHFVTFLTCKDANSIKARQPDKTRPTKLEN